MNNTFYAPNDYRYYLEHHGVKGMKWGVRRYQNADGSLTATGRSRYGASGSSRSSGGVGGALRSMGRKITGADLTEEQREARNAKAAKIALAVTGTAAVAAGAYVAHKYYGKTMAEADSALRDEAIGFVDREFRAPLAVARMNESALTKAAHDKINEGNPWGAASILESRNKESMRRLQMESDRAKAVESALGRVGRKNMRRAAQREIIKRDIATAFGRNAGDTRDKIRNIVDPDRPWPEDLLKEAAARQARKMRGY